MATAEDDEYEIPLRDQRYFGAGIKRKRIQFVPSTSNEATVQGLPTTPSQSAADKYLSIVFNKSGSAERAASAPLTGSAEFADSKHNKERRDAVEGEHVKTTCDICHRPITSGDAAAVHESSIVHQICQHHSHPPSHIDRRRRGLTVLEGQGWDPDGRRGLGAEGEGRLYPIKAKENPGKAGLGVILKDLKPGVVEKPLKLDAGKVRLMETEGKKKAQRLRDLFYRSDDMEKYLGGGGETNVNLDLATFKHARRR